MPQGACVCVCVSQCESCCQPLLLDFSPSFEATKNVLMFFPCILEKGSLNERLGFRKAFAPPSEAAFRGRRLSGGSWPFCSAPPLEQL